MKIKIVSNYDTEENMFKSSLNCFDNTTNLQLVMGDTYDKLVIINGYRGKIKTQRENVIGVLQEPIGNINYDRNLHFYCDKILCQSKKMFTNYGGIKETFLPMFYRHHENTKNNYFINFNNFDNRKKLCLIMSSISMPNNRNWTNHNYTKRHDLLKKMLNSKLDFDFYGRGWGNLSDHRFKGEANNKHEILRKYQYSIAIENVCENNYISEKLFDCFLNNTVPLYYGCPNADQIFSPKSFIQINIEEDKIVDSISNIIENDTDTFQDHIIKSKQNYFDKLNLFTMLSDVIER